MITVKDISIDLFIIVGAFCMLCIFICTYRHINKYVTFRRHTYRGALIGITLLSRLCRSGLELCSVLSNTFSRRLPSLLPMKY